MGGQYIQDKTDSARITAGAPILIVRLERHHALGGVATELCSTPRAALISDDAGDGCVGATDQRRMIDEDAFQFSRLRARPHRARSSQAQMIVPASDLPPQDKAPRQYRVGWFFNRRAYAVLTPLSSRTLVPHAGAPLVRRPPAPRANVAITAFGLLVWNVSAPACFGWCP